MATQLGDVDVLERIAPASTTTVQEKLKDLELDDGRPTAARGILFGIAVSMPFWGLVAFTLYLLS